MSIIGAMVRRRQQRTKNAHFCILVNRKSGRYVKKPIEKLIAGIRRRGDHYTLLEPRTAMELYEQAGQMARHRKENKSAPANIQRWGKITALVACGGDGTFNLVARAAQDRNMPMGVLPMGRFNNIARHLLRTTDCTVALEKILAGSYRAVDAGIVNDQIFFGSIGLGLIPKMVELLKDHKRPRFGIGWSKLAHRAAEAVERRKTILKVDAFRFEVEPLLLNINMLSYSAGLKLSPASVGDDQKVEVIFDRDHDPDQLAHYVRMISRDSYLYADEIGLYRGAVINIQPTQGRILYLDGELLKLPGQSLDISISDRKLKVFC
jgi:diacylglycerol kinase family enzyme